jgi:hypothetical protein
MKSVDIGTRSISSPARVRSDRMRSPPNARSGTSIRTVSERRPSAPESRSTASASRSGSNPTAFHVSFTCCRSSSVPNGAGSAKSSSGDRRIRPSQSNLPRRRVASTGSHAVA